MAPLSAIQTLWASTPRACSQCVRRHVPSALSTQRRYLRRSHGPKYTAKLETAQAEWKERAERIRSGQQPDLWDTFVDRGYVKDVVGSPDSIQSLLLDKRIGAYVGIDPTAPSLHIGHLLPLMPIFWMYLHGYKAYTVIGGSTAKIGDPTDRLKDRDKLPPSTISMNLAKIHFQLKRLWGNVVQQGTLHGYEASWAQKRGVLQNGQWWGKLTMMEVLKRLGNGVRIGPMLSRDTVKQRLDSGAGMSFAEFTYPVMQAWDWWRLYESLGVQMQVGGSDQYGNIVFGANAVKNIRDNEPDPGLRMPGGPMNEPVGFTVPLLTDSSGAKFGKSAGNAIWLDPYMTSSFDLYGYFMRRPDDDVEKLLKLFTFLPPQEIQTLMEQQKADPRKRVAHHALALEVLSMVHGRQVAKETQTQHRDMYSKNRTVPVSPVATSAEGTPIVESGTSGNEQTNQKNKAPVTLNNAPRIDMKLPESLIRGGRIARILHAVGLAGSVAEGQRLAVQQGAYIGGAPGQTASMNKGMDLGQLQFTPVALWFPQDTNNFLIDEKYLILRKGKHNVRIVEMVSDEEWEKSGLTYPGEQGKGMIRVLTKQIKKLEAELEAESGSQQGEGKGQSLVGGWDKLSGDEQREALGTGTRNSTATADDAGSEAEPSISFPEKKPPRMLELQDRLARVKHELEKVHGREAAADKLASILPVQQETAFQPSPTKVLQRQKWVRRGSSLRQDMENEGWGGGGGRRRGGERPF